MIHPVSFLFNVRMIVIVLKTKGFDSKRRIGRDRIGQSGIDVYSHQTKAAGALPGSKKLRSEAV